MKPPTSRKKVRKFMGVVNCYRNMWPRRSHVFVPLNKSTSIKNKFEWMNVEQDDFDKIKQIVVRDIFINLSGF